MRASDVSRIIDHEIGANLTISNPHGVDLKTSLLSPPIKMIYNDPSQNGKPIELWLVLVEMPQIEEGYQIVFDENIKKFGLAVINGRTKERVFLGFYGSFLNTLEAM